MLTQLFGKPSFESITKGLSTMTRDLEALATNNTTQVSVIEESIRSQREQQEALKEEANRAAQTADRLRNLIA